MLQDALTDTYAVMFNGPPSCGKDTAARMLYNVYSMHHSVIPMWERFSDPLKRSVCAWFDVECDQWGNSAFEPVKDQIIPELGVSYRQAQIDLSEKHMKRYGKDVFGKLLVRRVINRIGRDVNRQATRIVIIPDSGFYDEASALIDLLPPGHAAIAQIRRAGTTFDGDSRSYVEHPRATMIYIDNAGEQIDFENDVVRIMKKWLPA